MAMPLGLPGQLVTLDPICCYGIIFTLQPASGVPVHLRERISEKGQSARSLRDIRSLVLSVVLREFACTLRSIGPASHDLHDAPAAAAATGKPASRQSTQQPVYGSLPVPG